MTLSLSFKIDEPLKLEKNLLCEFKTELIMMCVCVVFMQGVIKQNECVIIARLVSDHGEFIRGTAEMYPL